MEEKGTRKSIVVIKNVLVILIAVTIAIIGHVMVPTTVNAGDFDSIFVKLFGFPIVAVTYFVMLFTYCAIVMCYFGKNLNISKVQIGTRFGLAFSMIYFFGMQEVVVEASPFTEWGFSFVKYQFYMGISDAVPVFLLCILVAYFTLNSNNNFTVVNKLATSEKIKAIAFITVAFLTERTFGYETRLIESNCNTFPIPCYAWTILFGIVLGFAYVTLYPVFSKEQNKLLQSAKLAILTIGINWIIFNSFIGLIFSGVMTKMLLRSGLDIVVLFLSSIFISRYFVKADRLTKDM